MHDSLAVLNERLLQEGWRPLSNPVDLLEETELFVPANPGIYAFVLSGEKLPYPNSESSVAYIGETGNLSERIAVHRYHARTC
ncbi:hypothetical protein AB0N17_38450, partial [Streptomyces sp. NPDC051133]|uniref:hypothetical protein n=1 Tax=Streptomyces sp. NPDC051133 TaxID=3155521 RepID=UPI003435DFA3